MKKQRIQNSALICPRSSFYRMTFNITLIISSLKKKRTERKKRKFEFSNNAYRILHMQ